MFYHLVGIARDWAIILLVLEGMVLCALPLFVLLKCVQAMAGFLPRARAGLQNARRSVERVIASLNRLLAAVVAPFLWVEGLRARVDGFWRAWKRA